MAQYLVRTLPGRGPLQMVNDNPHDPEPIPARDMTAIAHSLDALFNGEHKGVVRTTGFVLLVYPMHDRAGRCAYASNSERSDVIRLLEEQITHFRQESDDDG